MQLMTAMAFLNILLPAYGKRSPHVRLTNLRMVSSFSGFKPSETKFVRYFNALEMFLPICRTHLIRRCWPKKRTSKRKVHLFISVFIVI